MKTKSPLFIAFITIFLDLLGFGMIIPIQPFYAEKFGASPTLVTLLGASYSLMQFIFSPIWGRLSDRVGRRPIILWSVFFSAVGHLLFGFANSLAFLFLSRTLAGFGNANLGTAQAIISDSTTHENRTKGMGLIGAAFGLGFILGPTMGGILSQWSPAAPAFAAAFLCFINFIFSYFFLPETLQKNKIKINKHQQKFFSFLALKEVLKVPFVPPLLIITFFYVTAFSMMEQVLSLLIEAVWVPSTYLGDHYARAALLTSYLLLIVGIVASIVQGGLIGKLNKKFSEPLLIQSGLLILIITFFMIHPIVKQGSYLAMLVAGAFMATGTGFLNPSLSSYLSKKTKEEDQGGVLGMNQSIGALARVIGPTMAGRIFEVSITAPFLIGAVLFSIAFIFSMKLVKK